MDNLHMDRDENENIFSRWMENQKIRLAAALAVGLIIGSGATWATMSTDKPRKPKAVVAERQAENRATPVQSNKTTSKQPSTKKVSLKAALKDCNKITNKTKRQACITRTKKAYAKRTSSTTRRASSSVKPATIRTQRVAGSSNAQTRPVEVARADNHLVGVAE